MNYNKLNLTLTAIFMISLFFAIPIYNRWFYENIFNPYARVTMQAAHLGVYERMASRFGSSYVAYRGAVAAFGKYPGKNVLLLLPPNDYLRAEGVRDFQSVEPSEFYYFTGYKAVWANSPDVEKANWAFIAIDHKVVLSQIKNKQQLDQLLATYKKYKSTIL